MNRSLIVMAALVAAGCGTPRESMPDVRPMTSAQVERVAGVMTVRIDDGGYAVDLGNESALGLNGDWQIFAVRLSSPGGTGSGYAMFLGGDGGTVTPINALGVEFGRVRAGRAYQNRSAVIDELDAFAAALP
jgi:hypothetical protein